MARFNSRGPGLDWINFLRSSCICSIFEKNFSCLIFSRIIWDCYRELIDKLLLEKIPLAGIARVTGVSEGWLQTYVNAKYDATPKQVDIWPKKRGA